MLNQTADEMSIKFFIRGLNLTLKAKVSVDELELKLTHRRDRSAEDMGENRGNTVLRLYESQVSRD